MQSIPDKEIEDVRNLARKMARDHLGHILFVCFAGGCRNEKVELHHEDYTKPLNIIPFCNKHHKQRHTEIRRAKLYNILKEKR